MKHKCFNFKLFILAISPIVGVVLSLCVVIFSCTLLPACIIGLFFCVICLLFLFFLLINEPLYYYIDDNGVEIHSFFKKKIYTWQEIVSIKLVYDVVFEFLFIKDYVVFHTKDSKYVRRMDRIVKCKKTTKLINQFYHKVIE